MEDSATPMRTHVGYIVNAATPAAPTVETDATSGSIVLRSGDLALYLPVGFAAAIAVKIACAVGTVLDSGEKPCVTLSRDDAYLEGEIGAWEWRIFLGARLVAQGVLCRSRDQALEDAAARWSAIKSSVLYGGKSTDEIVPLP